MINLMAIQKEEIQKALSVKAEIEKELNKIKNNIKVLENREKRGEYVLEDKYILAYTIENNLRDIDNINANLILQMAKNAVRLSLDNFYSIEKNKNVPLRYKKVMASVEKDLNDFLNIISVCYDDFYEHVFIKINYNDLKRETYISFKDGKPKGIFSELPIKHLTFKQLLKRNKDTERANDKIKKLNQEIDNTKLKIQELQCLNYL